VKKRLIELAGRGVTADGVLVLVSRGDRSQAMNSETVHARLLALLKRASTPPPPRVPTEISRAVWRERVASKQRHSALKRLRRGGKDV
jgi:ribosome-associated protein